MLGFARVAAESGHALLVTGETGSGKTHLAREIHRSGPRASRPFVRVNCAAIPDSLFEREMFGHVRGACTDARDAAAGFLEAAHGGTLFLDEIAELAPQNQPKLLAVLEDGCFRKLGSPREVRVDVQVITAANRDLVDLVAQKQFRQDLFYGGCLRGRRRVFRGTPVNPLSGGEHAQAFCSQRGLEPCPGGRGGAVAAGPDPSLHRVRVHGFGLRRVRLLRRVLVQRVPHRLLA
jgi:hypothetical protein